MNVLLKPMRTLAQIATFANGAKYHVGPFPTSVDYSLAASDEVVRKLDEAFHILADIDPARCTQLRRYVRKLAIVTGIRIAYGAETRIGFVHEHVAVDRTAPILALVLADIAIRAEVITRLHGRNLRVGEQERLLRRVYRAQASISDALRDRGYPEGAPLLADYRAKLESMEAKPRLLR